jgi:hypothetical protein
MEDNQLEDLYADGSVAIILKQIFKKIRFEDMVYLHLTQYREQWPADWFEHSKKRVTMNGGSPSVE